MRVSLFILAAAALALFFAEPANKTVLDPQTGRQQTPNPAPDSGRNVQDLEYDTLAAPIVLLAQLLNQSAADPITGQLQVADTSLPEPNHSNILHQNCNKEMTKRQQDLAATLPGPGFTPPANLRTSSKFNRSRFSALMAVYCRSLKSPYLPEARKHPRLWTAALPAFSRRTITQWRQEYGLWPFYTNMV